MTCKSLDIEQLAAWVDGALGAEAARDVACHVAVCSKCHHAAEELRTETDALRQMLGTERAPAHLWGRISSQLATDTVGAPKRFAALRLFRQRLSKPMIGTMLAASLAVGIFVQQWPETSNSPDLTLSMIAAETAQDFVTFQLSQRALDVVSDVPAETITWLASRLETALPEVPENVLNYRLVGGRLCWLMGQRLGALTYAHGSERVTVYLMPVHVDENLGHNLSTKSHTTQHTNSPVQSVVWSEHGLAIAIVSDLPDAEKFRFAEAFDQALNNHFLDI